MRFRLGVIRLLGLFLVLGLWLGAAGISALALGELHVPRDYGTIQEAIDPARPGDVILVEPGTYVEKPQDHRVGIDDPPYGLGREQGHRSSQVPQRAGGAHPRAGRAFEQLHPHRRPPAARQMSTPAELLFLVKQG